MLDRGATNASVCDDTLMIHRGLLGGPWLEPILAHELGHLRSSDGRTTAALGRLIIFQPTYPPGGLLGPVVRLALGGTSLRFLGPAWGVWWRQREYAADLYAARLGQASALAKCLQAEALPYDFPVPFMALGAHTHPYSELRIDRLHAYEDRALGEYLAAMTDEEFFAETGLKIPTADLPDPEAPDRQDPQP